MSTESVVIALDVAKDHTANGLAILKVLLMQPLDLERVKEAFSGCVEGNIGDGQRVIRAPLVLVTSAN